MNGDLPFPYQKKKSLSKFSTFGIGGEAHYFAEAYTKEQMKQMLEYAYRSGLAFHILGKGSNSLFDDRGFKGLVILNRINFLKQKEGTVIVGGGYGFARLGGITARRGWSGLEFALGIPATVGGAVYMNAGANGKTTADVLEEVGYVNQEGRYLCFKKKELYFGYRSSSFQKQCGAIVQATFLLTCSKTAKTEQKEILNYRLKTQPYGDKSAGCAFRNPVGEGAGRLIEASGLKGMHQGGAFISTVHANFIVNKGGATARDVLDLIEQVKEKVYRYKGVVLEEEIRYIPYEPEFPNSLVRILNSDYDV